MSTVFRQCHPLRHFLDKSDALGEAVSPGQIPGKCDGIARLDRIDAARTEAASQQSEQAGAGADVQDHRIWSDGVSRGRARRPRCAHCHRSCSRSRLSRTCRYLFVDRVTRDGFQILENSVTQACRWAWAICGRRHAASVPAWQSGPTCRNPDAAKLCPDGNRRGHSRAV